MAIKIVTGVPGSGKTYFVVREVISKNYRFSKTYAEWVPRDPGNPVTIITNVSGLRLPHVRLDDVLTEFGYKTHRELFTLNGIRPVQAKYGYLVLVVDEAQGYFPRSFRDNPGTSNGEDNKNSVFYFFEKHRHEGIDIYLCAQLYKRLNPDISELCEYHIHAVRRSFSIRGEFKYRIYLGGQEIEVIKFPFHARIGAVYQTVQVEQELQGKKVNPYRKLMLWGFLLVVFLSVLIPTFIYRFKNMGGSSVASSDLPSFDSSGKPSPEPGLSQEQMRLAGVALRPAPPTGSTKATKTRAHKAAAVPESSPAEPVQVNSSLVMIRTGGMWFDGQLIAIQIFENLYTPDTIPFTFHVNNEDSFVEVYVPSSLVAEYGRPLPFIASQRSSFSPSVGPGFVGESLSRGKDEALSAARSISEGGHFAEK